MEEYFTVADEDDNVLGKEKRSICHRDSIIHRSIAIFIFNNKGEILFQKRSLKKDLYGGYWGCSVSGHVTYGEEYEETAQREMKEELGIETNLEKVGWIKTREKPDFENTVLFKGIHEGPFKIDKEETDFVKFFPVEDIRKMIEREDKFTICFLEALKIIV